MAVTKVTRRPHVEVEVPQNVINHADRGDNRGVPTRTDLDFQREAEKKSPEELRAEADKQLKGDHWQNVIGPQVSARISAVLERYVPMGYKDSEKNGLAIATKLSSAEAIQERRRQHRADNDYSLLEIAAAVEALLAEGRLDINEAAAHKQRIEAYSEQLASVPSSEDALYSMPMSELRARASGNYDPLGPK